MEKHLTLWQLQQKIKIALEEGVGECWVVAEIHEMNVNNSGHCYITFVEKSADSQAPKARINGVIWRSQYAMISGHFRETTGSALKEGIKVLVKVDVSYHELYGISLVIKDIDPSYTLGDIERQRLETIKQLREDGVFDMNRGLELPVVVERIAVISSDKAAGYRDFINQLRNNEFGYRFATWLHVAFMQGEEAESSIISALGEIAERAEDYDTVVLIRGGGSRIDLAAFDSYRLCSYIAQFPLPVLTGIGHDKDVSVADMVAFEAFKTPTAVASAIIDRAAAFEEFLTEAADRIKERAREVLTHGEHLVESFSHTLRHSVTGRLHGQELRLSELYGSLISSVLTVVRVEEHKHSAYSASLAGKSRRALLSAAERVSGYGKEIRHSAGTLIERGSARLELLASGLRAVDPERILQLGYSLTFSQGRVVRSVNDVNESDIIEIRLTDGTLESEIINKKKI